MPTVTETSDRHTVRINLPGREYDVIVGEGLLQESGHLISELSGLGKRCAVITDTNVGPLFGQTVTDSLKAAGFEPTLLTVKAGEASKSMEQTTAICREMLQAGLDRKSFVVALGGGVIGDLAGFCAAIFQRGIPFVQIPTTVVSLVDSAVGGKTGVNTPEGKNLLGAFLQPKLVLADMATLQTLPDREYREGFAEAIKHAAIRDEPMVDLIEKQGESRQGLIPLIARNVAIKAAVVEEDEQETSGVRALLNFGHTIGHAIEAAAGYGELFHGEAISLGTIAALRLSERLSGLSGESSARIEALLRQFKLPQSLDEQYEPDKMLSLMQRDKKFAEGQIRFVLLRSLGDAFVSDAVTETDIRREMEALIARS